MKYNIGDKFEEKGASGRTIEVVTSDFVAQVYRVRVYNVGGAHLWDSTETYFLISSGYNKIGVTYKPTKHEVGDKYGSGTLVKIYYQIYRVHPTYYELLMYDDNGIAQVYIDKYEEYLDTQCMKLNTFPWEKVSVETSNTRHNCRCDLYKVIMVTGCKCGGI